MRFLDVTRLLRAGGMALLLTVPGRSCAAPEAQGHKAAPSRPGDLGADRSLVPDLGRYFGTWLWIKSEGLVADSDPETKGAARTLVLRPDMTYEFHERRATRDTVLCRGGYLFSEQSEPGGNVIQALQFEGWYESYERRMLADFEGPDTLHLAGYSCENCPDHAFVRGRTALFGARVTRGERFVHDLWDGLRLELNPLPLGWEIAIRDTMRPGENLARLTPPGPNRGDVNAPRQRREFIFSREVGKTIQGPSADHGVTEEEVERVAREGRGVLTVEEMNLAAHAPGGRAGIEWMRFTAAVEEVGGGALRPAEGPAKRGAGP
ncbi:MAG: hypothetical protein E6K76_06610 [Candidatus Eisenbacteria bacterium]|uniref:Lipocalin-like domain-containing protein n=1 Tax=Eiseniibacteriota bacterium TaxID=2212470 RepID=A0A538T5J2_UNCEI|nr:MAG: hypothetical protein E6K76_06610 [Candidatus Eisenbacteria bacterium]